ncbi:MULTISPECIES: helix-turn-helix domain-containing protein [Janthinobacterium]|uniref:helix-turn-helix domain-containing protein n=1 Tax=Janthinobacterium sp. 35 TaxID=2035210 RepID=UPI000C173DF5|nr:helix-turn-helix transcriptional regulator [Janthinobacterium sp. 35]PIG25517.1 transcriptional regulator with XRE-family HTH domain [Janthinobacterium sp. 35]
MTTNPSLPDEQTDPPQLLMAAQRRALAENMLAAMDVAGAPGRDGQPGKLNQSDLAAATGIARSTLSRFVTENTDKPPNPDLDTLCRIAEALNIPPFFLLMGKSDWVKMAEAVKAYLLVMDDVELSEAMNNYTQKHKVLAGIELAQRFDMYQPDENVVAASDRHEEIQADLARRSERSRRAILSATAVSQLSSREKNRVLLTTIGAIFGAMHQ